MNEATSEKLVKHHSKCGSHEFDRDVKDDKIVYKCRKCKKTIRSVED